MSALHLLADIIYGQAPTRGEEQPCVSENEGQQDLTGLAHSGKDKAGTFCLEAGNCSTDGAECQYKIGKSSSVIFQNHCEEKQVLLR